MYDAKLWCGQEQQGCAQLLSKLACQIERNTTEIGVSQEVVQIVGQKLKHQAKVVPKHEVSLQVHC